MPETTRGKHNTINLLLTRIVPGYSESASNWERRGHRLGLGGSNPSFPLVWSLKVWRGNSAGRRMGM